MVASTKRPGPTVARPCAGRRDGGAELRLVTFAGRARPDVTVIRSVVLPGAMCLLGDRNWYLPRWLNWLPRLQVEGRR